MPAAKTSYGLSILFPLQRFPTFWEHTLRLLDKALIAEDAFAESEAEVILSPAFTQKPTERKIEWGATKSVYHSFVTVLLPPPATRMGQVWVTRTQRDIASETEDRSNYFGIFFEAIDSRKSPQEGPWSTSAALNRAALAARGSIFLLLDAFAEPTPGFMGPLRHALSIPGVGIAGGLIRDAQGRIRHAGFDVALGPLPLSRSRTPYGSPYEAFHGDVGGHGEELGIPYERWRGLAGEGSRYGSRAAVGEQIIGVGLGLMALRAGLWTALGGLNVTLPPDFAALDLCLRANEDEANSTATVYVNSSLVHLAQAPTDTRSAELATHYDSVLPAAWRTRWGPLLAARVRSRWKLNVTVVWNMECGSGAVRGFTDEAMVRSAPEPSPSQLTYPLTLSYSSPACYVPRSLH